MRIKSKISAKFRASRHLRFEDTKRITSPEMGPKHFSGHNVFVVEKTIRTSMQGQSSLQHCTLSTHLQLSATNRNEISANTYSSLQGSKKRGGSGKVVSSTTHFIV